MSIEDLKVLFRRLEEFDTPTICNALEMTDQRYFDRGYTTEGMVCLNGPRPRVGRAYTATMRSLEPSPLKSDELKRERLEYYRYMYGPGNEEPKVAVMQDLDGRNAARGPFWGEFNSRIHRSMGYEAVVTSGSVRDVEKLPDDLLMLSAGLRPSHAHVHIVDFGIQVNVCGMVTEPGDIVHADSHGAVVFAEELIEQVLNHAADFVAREAPIIEAAKSGDLTFDRLAELYMERKRNQ